MAIRGVDRVIISVEEMGASLRDALLGGANLTAITVTDADFFGADFASARLVNPIGLDAAKNFNQAINLDRILHE